MADSFLPPVVAVLTANISEFSAKMGEARAEMDETEGSTAKLGAGSKIALLGVAAAAAGVAYESVKMASTYDSEMTRINSQDNANLTTQQMKSLRNSVLDLAGPTAQAPDALAEAMIHVYGSGLKGAKALQVLKIAAEGATVGHANLTDVTNALDAAIAVGIPGVQNYSQAMGELNATVGAGDMTMQNLAEALGGPMLATVKGYGLNITDVGAALATFGDRNIRGAEAATELRMATQALAVPAATGAAALQHIGLSTTSLRDDLEHGGLKEALNDLNSHLLKAGYTSKTAGAEVTAAFGKKAGGGLNVLLDSLSSSTSNFNDKFKEVASTGKTFGKSWADTQDTLAFKMKSLGTSVESLGIKLGNILMPYVIKFLGWIQQGIGWLDKHRTAMEALGVVLGGILLAGLVAATSATIAFTAALVTNPIFLAVAAFAALAAGVVYAWNHFTWFRDAVKDVGSALKAGFMAAVHAAGAVLRWFIDGPVAFVRSELKVFGEFWKEYGAQIEQIVKGIWNTVATVFMTEIKIIIDVLKPFFTVMTGLFTTAWHIVENVVKIAWNLVTDTIRTGVDLVLHIIGLFVDLFTGHWSRLGSDVKKLVGGLISDLGRLFGDFAKGAIHLLAQAGEDIVKGLINGIKSMFSSVTSIVGDLGHGISGAFKSVLGIFSPSRVMTDHGRMVAQGLIVGMQAERGNLVAAAGAMGHAINGGIGSSRTALPGITGTGTNTSGAGGTMQVSVYVQAPMYGTPQQLVRALQTAFQQANLRNGASLLSNVGVTS